jgi:hypothetical protein
MLVARRGMSLPRKEQQEEKNSGSRDRELRRPDGDAVRKQLRHRQLPPAGKPDRARRKQGKAPDQPCTAVEDEAFCTATTVHQRH